MRFGRLSLDTTTTFKNVSGLHKNTKRQDRLGILGEI